MHYKRTVVNWHNNLLIDTITISKNVSTAIKNSKFFFGAKIFKLWRNIFREGDIHVCFKHGKRKELKLITWIDITNGNTDVCPHLGFIWLTTQIFNTMNLSNEQQFKIGLRTNIVGFQKTIPMISRKRDWSL